MAGTITRIADTRAREEILQWKRPSQAFLWLTALGLVCAGTCDTMMAKLQSRQSIYPCEGCKMRLFEGAFWQTLISYFLETALIFVYWWDQWKARLKNKSFNNEYVHLHTTAKSFVKPTCPFYLWAIPGFLDFLTSVGVNIAIMYIRSSTLQVLRNFNIIATAILSLIWVRVALRVHQLFGVILVTVGLILVGIQELLIPDEKTNYSSPEIGVIAAIVGTIANALQVVVEEYLFRKYHVSPCESLGYFGIAGLICSLISYGVLEIISTSSPDTETLTRVIYSLSNDSEAGRILIITTCILIVSICTFNLTGMTVTKLGSCLLRMIVISLRTLTIWMLELIFWEEFKPVVLIGLIVTLIGALLYNYNYLAPDTSASYDRFLKKPMMCFSFLKDPDVLEAEILEEIKLVQYQYGNKAPDSKIIEDT